MIVRGLQTACGASKCSVGEVVFSPELFVQTLIAGVMIGVLYALMALGITFIYSIVKMINWAMGEFYMIGSYFQYLLVVEWFGADSWWIAAAARLRLGVFVLGSSARADADQADVHARQSSAETSTRPWSRSLCCSCCAISRPALGGPYQRTPGSNLPTVMLARCRTAARGLAAFFCALAAIALFYLLLKKTWLGLALRATAQSRVGVQTAGVDVLRLDQIAFGIGVALAGLAGALLAPVFLVFPTNGIVTTVKGLRDHRDRRARLDSRAR